VPERAVNAVTTVFRPLFYPPVVVAVLVALGALDAWLFGYHGIAQSVRQTLYNPAFILLTLGLVILSAAFHECGHATACRYGGARPGKMGVGLYLVWPAFYTDVTDAYRLDKKGRLRTDLGGVYFNAIFILLTGAAYFATGFEPLLLVIPLQHAEILHQFLPVIRLDGYYIVSDLAGVPDMFQRIGPTMRSLLPWRKPEPAVAELKRWVRGAVGAYVLVLVPLLLFVLALTVINVPRILATSWDSGLLETHRISHAADAGHWLTVVVGCIQLLVLVLIPVGLLLTLAQLARRVATKAWTLTDERPIARSALVVGGLAAAAFAAYAWLPASVYRPIQPGERGDLTGAFDQLAALTSGRPALTPERARELGGAPFRSDRPTAPSAPSAPPLGPGPAEPPPRPAPATPSGSVGTSPSPPPHSATVQVPPVQVPPATVSTPIATATTPGLTVTTPSVPLPTVTVPTVSVPSVSVPTVTTPTVPTP
jgi:putative peptide zinc metalloprotease protein